MQLLPEAHTRTDSPEDCQKQEWLPWPTMLPCMQLRWHRCYCIFLLAVGSKAPPAQLPSQVGLLQSADSMLTVLTCSLVTGPRPIMAHSSSMRLLWKTFVPRSAWLSWPRIQLITRRPSYTKLCNHKTLASRWRILPTPSLWLTALLAELSVTALSPTVWPTNSKTLRSKIPSDTPLAVAYSSASAEDWAITVCFRV